MVSRCTQKLQPHIKLIYKNCFWLADAALSLYFVVKKIVLLETFIGTDMAWTLCILVNPNALDAISKDMRAVKLCSNKISSFGLGCQLTQTDLYTGCKTVVTVVLMEALRIKKRVLRRSWVRRWLRHRSLSVSCTVNTCHSLVTRSLSRLT